MIILCQLVFQIKVNYNEAYAVLNASKFRISFFVIALVRIKLKALRFKQENFVRYRKQDESLDVR